MRLARLENFGGVAMKAVKALVGALLTVVVWAEPAAADSEAGNFCDGRHDDTRRFNAAIAATPPGGILQIPVGQCQISSTLVINKPITIVGNGFGSQIYGTQNNTLFQLVNVSNAAIRDVYLGSNSTQPGVSLIELVNSGHNQINNVTMLGGYYRLHLKGSLLNTIIDLRSGVNFGGFFAPTSVTNTWIMAEAYNGISANANTFIAPVLEGGINGLVLTDINSNSPSGINGQGSLQVLGGTIEGVANIGLIFQDTFLPSSITGVHFEANGKNNAANSGDILIQASNNIRISNIVSSMPINILGDSRNISITDSSAQTIFIDIGTNPAYPLGNGAKRILLQNITACLAANGVNITPAPTVDFAIGQIPNGPSSPVIPNPGESGTNRHDIIYNNIGSYCNGG